MVVIRKVAPDDLKALLIFSKRTFFDAFYHLNKPEDMEAYATRFFTTAQLGQELSSPFSAFYFAQINNEIVGYIKLNYGKAQTDLQDSKTLEIERIYVSKFHQGKQVGRQLLSFAIQTAASKQLPYVWLGVWEHNKRAIKFYKQHGFELFSCHDFMLGNDLQRDVLMRKFLPCFPEEECF